MSTAALAIWIGLPVLGGAIGYVTNRIAVKMIFRPIQPKRVLGIKVQGLIGRRQEALADSIGRVVGGHLVHHDDIVRAFAKLDFEKMLGDMIDEGIGPKIEELRSLPLIGGFLTDDRVQGIRDTIAKSVMSHEETVLGKIEDAIREGLDVEDLVREKVAKFPVEKLEAMVLEVARRELRAIEILGGVLGAVIGLIQATLVTMLSAPS